MTFFRIFLSCMCNLHAEQNVKPRIYCCLYFDNISCQVCADTTNVYTLILNCSKWPQPPPPLYTLTDVPENLCIFGENSGNFLCLRGQIHDDVLY